MVVSRVFVERVEITVWDYAVIRDIISDRAAELLSKLVQVLRAGPDGAGVARTDELTRPCSSSLPNNTW